MSRPLVSLIALAAVALLLVWDSAWAGLPDPFTFPAPVALGSGAAPTGGHCTAG